MSADPQDVFDEVDAETSEFSTESPSTAVYLHQVKSELDNEWYDKKDSKTQRIGAYRIKDKLGEGGMAQVFRASQMSTDREVAVKVVSLKGGTRNDMAQQVFREASALAMIDHPNVISCFGFGEDRGRMYMALEILDGKDANDLIVDNNNQPFSFERLLDISAQAIAGFQMVYKAGFIHRDIKPANIFVNNDGVVKVADLGLAWKGADVSADGMKSGGLGTPSYMSPEQILDEVELDVRADIYSMGATIFFFATGRTPFIGDDPMTIMSQALNDTPPDMREFNSDIPESLCRVVQKAMQKDREMRYGSWKEMHEDICAIQAGKEPTNAEVVNELQQMIDQQGAFVPEGNGVNMNLVIAGFVGIIIAVVVIVVAFSGSTEVVEDDPKTNPVNTNTIAKEISVFHLPGFKSSGQANLHKDHISLNGGVLRCNDTKSLIQNIKQADVFSVELVLTPANDTQSGPARILTFSKTYAARNFTIAQNQKAYEIRVRTSTAQSGLRPRFIVEDVVSPNETQHLLFVREKEHHLLYINGAEAMRVDVFGHIGNWAEDFPLLLGNDVKNSSPWSGTIHQLNFIVGSTSAEAAQQRYQDWLAQKK